MTFSQLLDFEGSVFLSAISGAPGLRLCARLCLNGHHRIPPYDVIGRRGEDLLNAPTGYTDAQYVDLVWEPYLLFTVLDEVAGSVPPHEDHRGRCIRLYTRSWLLDQYREPRTAQSLRLGPVQHFMLACADHLVDVLAYCEPEVTDLGMRPFSFGEPLKRRPGT
jgi:hypothetical protein